MITGGLYQVDRVVYHLDIKQLGTRTVPARGWYPLTWSKGGVSRISESTIRFAFMENKRTSPCATQLLDRNQCKALLGLAPRDCYPRGYDSSCQQQEHVLRKCLGLASCAKFARVVYDAQAARKARVSANKGLQRCLQRKHLNELKCNRKVVR